MTKRGHEDGARVLCAQHRQVGQAKPDRDGGWPADGADDVVQPQLCQEAVRAQAAHRQGGHASTVRPHRMATHITIEPISTLGSSGAGAACGWLSAAGMAAFAGCAWRAS
jgi:hypothetical protein